jgi:DNA-binding NarL/FixJ family response regulator
MNTSNKATARAADRLTAAEKRVLALVSMAKTNKEIARALGISPSTVKRHLENVLKKLHFKNRIEAAIYGLSVNGCPQAIAVHCPLKAWHIEKEKTART